MKPKRSGEQHSGHAKFNSRPPAMLFDVDGTLVDSVYDHVAAWREALQQEGISVPYWKIHRRVGMSGKLFLPKLLREVGYQTSKSKIDVLEKRQAKAFAKRIKTISLLPGAAELLRNLSKIKVHWALATTGNRHQAEQLIRGLKIPDFVPVVTGDEVEKAKPAPDVFLLAAEELGVPLDECLVVGDSPWDLLAARRAKALGVGLLCGGYAQEELERAGAHRVFESPADLWENIADLGIYQDS